MIHTAKLSVQEYHKIVEAGILGDHQIELLEGELIELSPETPYHALSVQLDLKKQAYARARIAEYWVIDLKNHQLLLFREPEKMDYKHQP